MNRREVLRQGLTAGVAALTLDHLAGPAAGQASGSPGKAVAFPVSLNTSTLRGHKLPLTELIEIAGRAGYQGIEPWMDELDRHVESGGSLKDAGKRLWDLGLKVTGGIAFFEWMVDDEGRRKAG